MFDGETSVAVLGRAFAAQQDCGHLEQRTVERAGDVALIQKPLVGQFVLRPIDAALLVCVEQLLCRRQKRLLLVVSPDELAQKERQVVALCERGELRGVVESCVDQPTDPGASEAAEEVLGRALGETDRVDLHRAPSDSSKRDGCESAWSSTCSSVSKLPSPRMW